MSIYRDSAIVSIDGTVIVIIMVTAGAMMTRYNILDKHGAESLGKLILNLLLPALLFTEMIKSLDISKLDQFAILLFFCTIHVFLGCAIGWILSKITKAGKNMTRLIMACIAFQDTTAIPLIFAQVLGTGDITKSDKNFQDDAIGFVLIYTVFITVYKWTISYGMLKPVLESENLDINASLASVGNLPVIGMMGSVTSSMIQVIPVKKGWIWTIKKIMNPPIYSTIISIPLALIPYMKEYVFCGSGAVLTENIFAALVTMGATVSPLICILLGSKLSKGYPESADISNLHIAMIIVGKEIIMPLIGLGLAGLFYYYGIIGRVLCVSILIIYAGPTSLQLLMICTAHQNQVENISKVYMIMYATAALPMAAWTMGFLIILY
ncbi:hypothetical protein SteCoe_17370 [Stentor coeruleus]|uniref:Uncharacterized protein n=1 Tax=Stentor coeruleus TaxID=5963 RepID=A0A1R2BZ24_9CILI|nr:hypothetical protein SteCoe_17370 [Stentor coeruleus]